MSSYEDEVDYSEDPLEGVDIWGLETPDEVDEMPDLDPLPEVALPAQPTQSTVEGCISPMGDLAHLTFGSPSKEDIGLWAFTQVEQDTLASAAIGSLALFSEAVLQEIDTSRYLTHRHIEGLHPPGLALTALLIHMMQHKTARSPWHHWRPLGSSPTYQRT